jgi:hypothetical protein
MSQRFVDLEALDRRLSPDRRHAAVRSRRASGFVIVRVRRWSAR